jgi:hypothetical protein
MKMHTLPKTKNYKLLQKTTGVLPKTNKITFWSAPERALRARGESIKYWQK